MATLTVVRQHPRVLIGSCGVYPDRAFESLETDLDWLELQGVPVERLEPQTADILFGRCPEAVRIWRASGDAALPLFAVGEQLLSSGRVPTRHELAHLAAPHVRTCTVDALRRVADLATATALGRSDARAHERVRAEEAGFEASSLDAVEDEAQRIAERLQTTH